MGERFRQHYKEAKGAVMDRPGIGIYFATLAAAPTAGLAGYAPGCIFINTAGTVGSLVYFNSGTLTSATWTNIG